MVVQCDVLLPTGSYGFSSQLFICSVMYIFSLSIWVTPFQINMKNGARSQIFLKLGVHVRHVKLWLGHAFKGHISCVASFLYDSQSFQIEVYSC